MQMNHDHPHATAHARLLAELFVTDTERDWDWEGIRIGNKLHLYCYLRDAVVALAPFDLDCGHGS